MASEKSLEEEQAVNTFGWAAMDSSGVLSSFAFSRRATGEEDVRLKVLYCGICHSDLGCIKNEWGWCSYPLVPGHEIVGIATEVGSKVTKFKVGDRVGVGCMVGSCGTCLNCTQNLESYCPEVTMTCASSYPDGTPTYGGFSNQMVANEKFVIRIPEKLPLDAAAPLLCAGSTVYSAMKFYGLCSQGLHLGVVGLGGLGHVAVKFAKAFGMKVTVISTSLGKKEEAINQLRADSFLINTDTEQMQDAMETMDGIIDTVSALHPIEPLLGLLKSHQGKLIIVGLPNKQPELPVFSLINGRKMIGGNAVGGVKETQEMVDFAAEHNITADIEIVPMDYVNVLRRAMSNFDLSLMLKIHWLLLKPTSYTIFLPKN